MVDGSSFIPGLSSTALSARAARLDDADDGGKVGDLKLAALSTQDPSLADLQEELSFSHAKRAEKKSFEQESLRSRKEADLEDLIEKAQAVDLTDELNPDAQNQVIEEMEKGEINSIDGLRARAEEEAKNDAALSFAFLLSLKNAMADASPAALAIIDGALAEISEARGDAVIAGLNASEAAKAFAQSQDEDYFISDLRLQYQETTENYADILSAFLQMAERKGWDESFSLLPFLRAAAVTDISSGLSSNGKGVLGRALLDLKAAENLGTVKARSDDALHRLAEEVSSDFRGSPSSENLMIGILRASQNPGAARTDIIGLVKDKTPSQQVLFMQEAFSVMRGMPDYLFRPEDKKNEMIRPIQAEIDRLTFEMEA